MKCLVVITHPLSEGLCRRFSEKAIEKLVENKHEVSVEDLYEQRFQPSITKSERKTYYCEYNSLLVDAHARRLREAEALVLLFPTWWFGFPAMLKGWFDRVWGPGIAFDHAADFGPIRPRLKKLKKVLVITTLGSPWWVDRLLMRQPIRKILKRALLGACTEKCKLDFLSLYNSETINEKDIEKFSGKFLRVLDGWQ